MRLHLALAASAIVLLGACGSGDGSGPAISATLPADLSIPASEPGPVETEAAPPPESQPVPTEAPATEPPAAEQTDPAAPTDTVPPEAEDDDGMLWWPWVLAAVVVVGGAVALFGRRRSTGPTWSARTTTLLDQVDQMSSHLAALAPDGVRIVAASDALTLATLRGTLRDLVATAPGVDQQASLDRLTAPLAQLHGAVDAVALSAAAPTQPGAATVAQIATFVHTTSASVRADASMFR